MTVIQYWEAVIYSEFPPLGGNSTKLFSTKLAAIRWLTDQECGRDYSSALNDGAVLTYEPAEETNEHYLAKVMIRSKHPDGNCEKHGDRRYTFENHYEARLKRLELED